MIKALQLLVFPMVTWGKIAEARRGVAFVFFLYWLPMAVIAIGAEGYALTVLGDSRGEFSHLIRISQSEAMRYALAQGLAGLVLLFGGSTLVHYLGAGLHQNFQFQQSFTMVAYASSPLFLARLLDCAPLLNTWLCWGLGAALVVWTLYHGVGLVMRPEITKGFGMYLVTSICLVLISGIGHLICATILRNGRPW